jgi:hypothetical protein
LKAANKSQEVIVVPDSQEVGFTCPGCQSKKVRRLGKLAFFCIISAVHSFFLLFGFLFPPLWIVAAIALLLLPLTLFSKPVAYCLDCKKSYPLRKVPTDARLLS